MTVKKSVFKTYITYNIKDDSVLFQVDNADRMEEGSSGVGSLGDTERILKDRNMPDGDACRPDGTLKDASEMEWPDSPSEVQANLPETSDDDHSVLNLKRSLPRDDSDEEESGSADERKVSIPIVRQIIKYLPVLNQSSRAVKQVCSKTKGKQPRNRGYIIYDTEGEDEDDGNVDDEVESGNLQSKGQRKVSIPVI